MKPWIFAAGAVLLAGGCMKPKSIFSEEPHVVGKSQVEIGAYLAEVGGCHDCHTPGWAQAPGNVPEDQVLAGHAYINSLGEGGNDIPMAVTDGSGPHTAYIWFMPEPPENHAANR
jgi:hypothetical protein